MLIWLGALALASKWTGLPADVVVTGHVLMAPDQVHARLTDWRTWEAILPCASAWDVGAPSNGVGAAAEATYTIGPLRRRLVGVIRQDRPGLEVQLELVGKKGWFIQVTYEKDPPEGATTVTITSPVTPPKWPFTAVFYSRVKPAWETCYGAALTRLAGLPAGAP